MAETVGSTGFGTLLSAGDGTSSETFTNIAEVRTINGPGLNLEIVEATHMESPGNSREYLPTFIEGGEVTFDVSFLPNTSAQTVITTDLQARTKRNFRLTFPNSAANRWSFAGFYTGFTPSAEIDGMLSASVTIKVTGAVTIS